MEKNVLMQQIRSLQHMVSYLPFATGKRQKDLVKKVQAKARKVASDLAGFGVDKMAVKKATMQRDATIKSLKKDVETQKANVKNLVAANASTTQQIGQLVSQVSMKDVLINQKVAEVKAKEDIIKAKDIIIAEKQAEIDVVKVK